MEFSISYNQYHKVKLDWYTLYDKDHMHDNKEKDTYILQDM